MRPRAFLQTPLIVYFASEIFHSLLLFSYCPRAQFLFSEFFLSLCEDRRVAQSFAEKSEREVRVSNFEDVSHKIIRRRVYTLNPAKINQMVYRRKRKLGSKRSLISETFERLISM